VWSQGSEELEVEKVFVGVGGADGIQAHGKRSRAYDEVGCGRRYCWMLGVCPIRGIQAAHKSET
jgi:hypothetical protein